MITQERLKELLYYNPNSGLFHWKVIPRNGIEVGAVAGGLNDNGYVKICIDYQSYRAHRLAFLYMEGRMPTHQVDHEDQVRHNNRWDNLRECIHGVNGKNTKLHSNNTSGHAGVDKVPSGKWRARIKVEGKEISLGRYVNKEEAIRVRKLAEAHHNFHPNHGGVS